MTDEREATRGRQRKDQEQRVGRGRQGGSECKRRVD